MLDDRLKLIIIYSSFLDRAGKIYDQVMKAYWTCMERGGDEQLNINLRLYIGELPHVTRSGGLRLIAVATPEPPDPNVLARLIINVAKTMAETDQASEISSNKQAS